MISWTFLEIYLLFNVKELKDGSFHLTTILDCDNMQSFVGVFVIASRQPVGDQ